MKRFYKLVSLEPVESASDAAASEMRLMLDGRSVKTPAKTEVIVPGGGFAEAIAAEWDAQEDEIVPSSMPLTRLANTVIDGVSNRRDEVADSVVAYGNSDLVCYWADTPMALVEKQEAAWGPVLQWAKVHLQVEFNFAKSVVAFDQDDKAMQALAMDIASLDNYALGSLHEMTTLTGSVLISLAVLRGGMSAAAGWDAAHVDETFQTENWGDDDEAIARLAGRKNAFMSAVRALELLGVIG